MISMKKMILSVPCAGIATPALADTPSYVARHNSGVPTQETQRRDSGILTGAVRGGRNAR